METQTANMRFTAERTSSRSAVNPNLFEPLYMVFPLDSIILSIFYLDDKLKTFSEVSAISCITLNISLKVQG